MQKFDKTRRHTLPGTNGSATLASPSYTGALIVSLVRAQNLKLAWEDA